MIHDRGIARIYILQAVGTHQYQCVIRSLEKLAALLAKRRDIIPIGNGLLPEASNRNNDVNPGHESLKFLISSKILRKDTLYFQRLHSSIFTSKQSNE